MATSLGNVSGNHLLPFCTGSEQRNECCGNAKTSCDDGCVIDKFVGADVEEDDCGDEGAGVEDDGVPIHGAFAKLCSESGLAQGHVCGSESYKSCPNPARHPTLA